MAHFHRRAIACPGLSGAFLFSIFYKTNTCSADQTFRLHNEGMLFRHSAREQSDKSLTFAPSRPGKPARRKRSSFPIKTHADQTTHSRQSNAGSLRLPTVRAPGYGYVPQKFPHRYRTDQRLVRPSGFAAGCDHPQGGKPVGSPPCQALCLAAGAHPQPEICREPFLGLADGKPRLRPRLPEVRLVVGRPQRIRGKPAGRHRSHSTV